MSSYDGFTVLVMAKAPVPGQVKTRLGAAIGQDRAADLAAAALLDTLEATAASGAAGHLCLAGDLSRAVRRDDIARALDGWTVTRQRGDDFATRLVHGHADAGDGVVVQIGMDTPQVTGEVLRAAADTLVDHDAVLGPALDGGWWALARRDPTVAEVLTRVVMSTSSTCADTEAALVLAGHRVGFTRALTDVDTLADARTVARQVPGAHFARAWRSLPEAR